MSVNLGEKLALQLALHEDPMLMMSQIMFKRCFPNIWPVPADGGSYKDPLSELDVLVDNSIPHDAINIVSKET